MIVEGNKMVHRVKWEEKKKPAASQEGRRTVRGADAGSPYT